MMRPRARLIGRRSVKPFKLSKEQRAQHLLPSPTTTTHRHNHALNTRYDDTHDSAMRIRSDSDTSSTIQSIPDFRPPSVTIEQYLCANPANIPTPYDKPRQKDSETTSCCMDTILNTEKQRQEYTERLDQAHQLLFGKLGGNLHGFDVIHQYKSNDNGNDNCNDDKCIVQATVVMTVHPGTKHRYWNTIKFGVERIFEELTETFQGKWELAGVIFEVSES